MNSSTSILKLFCNKEFQIILFLFICSASSNSVYAHSLKSNQSKNKSTNLSCLQYIETKSTYYCWNGAKYTKTNKITPKEEKNKLAESSLSKDIQLDELIDEAKNTKLQITEVKIVNNNEKDNSKLLITPIIKRVQDEKPKEPEPSPGLSFGIPSAMGSSWRDVFVSVAYTADYDEGLFTWHNQDNNKVADGSMNFGFGFGDPNESIGGEISVGIISLLSQNGESGFGADGTAGLKFHKALPSLFNTHAAIAWTNPIKWGEATKKDTIYGVISKEFELRPDTNNKFPSLLTLGVGTGSHRSNRTIDDNRNDPNLFGGYGVQILPRVSIASSWNGNALNAGIGLSPFDFPLNFSIGLSDITNNSTNGAQFNINTGYSFRF